MRKTLQYVGRMDACVTSLALTQSSRVSLGLRTEVVQKHTHKTALTLTYGGEWKGYWMLFCLKDLRFMYMFSFHICFGNVNIFGAISQANKA